MNTPSSPAPAEALPERGDVAVEAAGPAALPVAAPHVRVPADWWYRLWRARGWAAGDGRRCPPPAPRSLAVARVRRMRLGSRAVLLWSLGFFAAAQLALVLALKVWHPTLTETWQAEKWEQLRQLAAREPDRPLAVMLGSSRTDDAFQAQLLNDRPGPGGKPWLAYNFGVPMVGPIRQGLYLDQMLQAGIRPRLLLVEFVPAMLNEPHKGLVSEENWTQVVWMTLPQVQRLLPYWTHRGHMAGTWLESRLVPWYALRIPLFRSVYTTLFPRTCKYFPLWECWHHWPHDEQGFRIPRSFTVAEFGNSWLGAWGTFAWTLYHLKMGEGSVQALRDLLERCRQEKIPTALVFMPESSLFRSWYRPEALAEARRLFAELSREYGALAIDAVDWVTDTDFRDGHHVQGEGARVFTTRLIEALRPLLDRGDTTLSD
jgi:hypothetical protein